MRVVSQQKHVHGVNVLLLQSVHLNDRVQLWKTEAEIGLRKLNKKEHLNDSARASDLDGVCRVSPLLLRVERDRGIETES